MNHQYYCARSTRSSRTWVAVFSVSMMLWVLQSLPAHADFGFVNLQTGMCAQPEGAGAPGARVVIERCNGSPAQAWRAVRATVLGGEYYLQWEGGRGPGGAALVMDIRPNAIDRPGDEVVLAPFGGINGPGVRSTQFQYRHVFPPRMHYGTTFERYRALQQVLCMGSTPGALSPLIKVSCRDEPGQFFAEYDRSLQPMLGEPVVCSVFEDGASYISPPSDAVYVGSRQNTRGRACIPDGSADGLCRRWFGTCYSVRTFQSVMFGVFDDGATNFTGPSDAVYIPPQGNRACIPDNTATGACRRWFGLARTVPGGRSVACAVFDDGYANKSNYDRAVYVPSPIPPDGRACVPDNGPHGLCRRWFGQCVLE